MKLNRYIILLDGKFWMTCSNKEACNLNIEGLNPPSMHSRFKVVTYENYTGLPYNNKNI